MKMRISIVLLIIIFLIIGAYIIKTAYDLSFEDKEDTKNFVVKFARWLLQVGRNVKDVTGYAVQKKWLPVINETNQSKIDAYYIE